MSFACALGMGTVASRAWSAKREPPSSWVARAPREQLAPFRILVAQGLRGGSRGAGLDTRLSVAGLWSADEAQPNSFCRFLALGANLGLATVRSLKVAHDPNSVSRVFLGPELRVGSAYLEDGPKQPVDFYLGLGALRFFESKSSLGLPNAAAEWGLRLSAGVAIPRSWHVTRQVLEPRSCDGGSCGIGLILLLVPNTIEVEYQRVSGANWGGGALGYTF